MQSSLRKVSAVLVIAILSGAALASPAIEVCLSDNDLPPFAYRPQGSEAKPPFKGVAIDLLHNALPANDYRLHITAMPWRRCLRNIEAGLMHIAVNAFEAENDKWKASIPYFELHNIYLYSRRHFKQGISLSESGSLKKHNICGLTSRDEARYKLGLSHYDAGALNFRALVAKLHAGHCDLVLESRESLAGLFLLDRSLKTLIQDPDLDEMPLPGTPVSALRYLIGHRAPDASILQQRINNALKIRQADKGGIARLVNAYLQ